MTSSSASSSESTASSSVPLSSIKLPPSLSQYNFDPLALHPFTSYASPNPNGNTQTVNCNHGNPYRQPLGGYPSPHAPIPTPIATTTTLIPPQQQSPPKPFAYTPPRLPGIFVPFRKDTSSPELSDILKSRSKSSSDVSKNLPMNTATLTPAAPSIRLSGS